MIGWTKDGEYMYLMVSYDELSDMAPDLDDEGLRELGWYLMKHWQDTMQDDINDLMCAE